MTPASLDRIYRFEGIEVDIARGCLKRGQQELHLRQKTFQVLVYLLEHHDRLVTKEELLEQVWRETAVTDDVLVQSVMDIRKALGDDPHRPRFVRTIPKVGYRFVGSVEVSRANGSMLVQTEDATSIEIEYEREVPSSRIAGLTRTLSATFPVLPGKPRNVSFVVATILLILVAAAAVVLRIQKNTLVSRRQPAETALPQVAGKKPVVVMYFENQSGSREFDWLRHGLADMLITDLSRSDALNVLSRLQLDVLLGRIGSQQADPLQLEEALEIARRSRADAVVLGSFAEMGGKLRIDIELHDAHSGQLLKAESLIADRPDQILSQVDLLSLKVASDLGAAANEPQEKARLTDVMTDNLEAYRYYSLALDNANAYHYKEAIALLEKAIRLDPNFAMAHARIGYAYAVTWAYPDKGKPYLAKAFQLSSRLTEKDRLYITAWYAIACLDFPGAMRPLRQIITEYPTESEAYERLGHLLQGEENYDEAIRVLKQGLIVDPENPNIYNRLGGIYSALGRFNEALEAHQRYVALEPNEPNAHDSLGLTYQWAGLYERAQQEFGRALELNPNFELAVAHLGNVYFQTGRYRDAARQFERYIRIAPSSLERSRGYACLASIYFARGEFDRAEQVVQEADRRDLIHDISLELVMQRVAVHRGNPLDLQKLNERLHNVDLTIEQHGARLDRRWFPYMSGYTALRSGRPTEALDNFKDVLKHKPLSWSYDSFEDCLADAYLELGQFDEAISEYRRILRLNPNYPLVHYHLGQAYEKKGQPDLARAEYQQFLQIWKDADSDIPEIIAAKQRLAS